jgi:hypothetical protein
MRAGEGTGKAYCTITAMTLLCAQCALSSRMRFRYRGIGFLKFAPFTVRSVKYA